jgi:hypothetical protein
MTQVHQSYYIGLVADGVPANLDVSVPVQVLRLNLSGRSYRLVRDREMSDEELARCLDEIATQFRGSLKHYQWPSDKS